MIAEIMIPIEALHGKMEKNAEYYFRTLHGKQIIQRCPKKKRTKTAAEQQNQAAFAERANIVGQLLSRVTKKAKKTRKELWEEVMRGEKNTD